MAALADVDGTWGSPRTVVTALTALRSLFRDAGVVGIEDLTPRMWREELLRLSQSTREARAGQLGTFFSGMDGLPTEFVRAVEATRVVRTDPEEVGEQLSDAQIEMLRQVCFDTIRDALDRVRAGWQLVAQYRSGTVGDPTDREYAAVLDEIARTGDIADRFPSEPHRRRVSRAALDRMYPGRSVATTASTMPAFRALYPTTTEIAACAFALVVTCGWNLSTALNLLVSDITRLDARDGSEPVHLRVRLSKGRLGQVTDWTESYFDRGARSKARLVMMVQELTEGARQTLAAVGHPNEHLLVCLTGALQGGAQTATGCPLHALADSASSTVMTYLANWRDKHPELAFATPRSLRHYFVTREHPQGHSLDMNADYVLRDPRVRVEAQPVIAAGIQAAFDDVVARVVASDVASPADAPKASGLGVLDEVNDGRRDTVAAACQDFDHFPDTNEPCRASFLTCFACRNAVVLKRHLPRILALRDHLDLLRTMTDPAVWAGRFAVHYARVSSLTEPTRFFSAADIDAASNAVTDNDRQIVKRLMAREWDI